MLGCHSRRVARVPTGQELCNCPLRIDSSARKLPEDEKGCAMAENMSAMSRRSFVKRTGALGALAAMGAVAGDSLFGQATEARAQGEETIVCGHCAVNCPGRCVIKFHVVDDEIVWAETDSTNDDSVDLQARACLRGRSYRRWLNDPDRLNYPMKRVGKRGEGKFERISWDEAVDAIAENLKRIMNDYGNDSIYVNYGCGVTSIVDGYSKNSSIFPRLMNCLGGFQDSWGDYSAHQMEFMTPYIFGSMLHFGGSTINVAEDAELILLFGLSPIETSMGGGIGHYGYTQMREKTKGKIIIIDPRANDAVAGYSEEWQPIVPGTDAALCAAIAHVLITEDMVDLDFLHTYCVGYDEETMPESAKGQQASYVDYIMGTGYDRIEKTPAWASPITGIPESRIVDLAHQVGSASPLFVAQGYGPQRRISGEYNCWSIVMLPLLTGQIGLPGTNSGMRDGSYGISLGGIPRGTNPYKTKFPVFLYTEAIERGETMTAANSGLVGGDRLRTSLKCIINYAGNALTNQHGNINRTHDILVDETKCEFILGIDTVLTDSMKYADILLPDLFRFEQLSMVGTGGVNAYMVAGKPCTTAKFERKSCYDMCTLIARKMGVEQEFTEGKTQEEWARTVYEKARAADPELPSFEEAFEMVIYKRKNPNGGTVALAQYRADPQANKLDTPSGKIEIYSESIAQLSKTYELADDETLYPLPAYVPEWRGVGAPTDEYPLRCVGFHGTARTHSCFGNIDVLKAAIPQQVWINVKDAEDRGISNGDEVRVSNELGEMTLVAKTTVRVVPGTVAMPHGAWHDADMDGDRVDRGGCINTLTTNRCTPLSKGNPQHSNICQVSKA